MIRFLLLTAVLYYATSAPVIVQNAEDRPVLRTKRSEEAIMYGNHQNFERTKKANFHPMPPPNAADSQEKEDVEGLNEPANMEQMNAKTESEEEKKERIDKLLTPDEEDIQEKEEQEEEEQQGGREEDDEEKSLTNIVEESKNADDLEDLKSEGLAMPGPGEITEEYQIIDDPTSGDGENAIPDADQSKYYQQEYDWDRYFNNKKQFRNSKFPLRSNFFKLYREKRSAASAKTAESVPKMVKAEDMSMMAAASSKLGGRVKRDLDFSSDDLEPYLDEGYYGQGQDYPEFYPGDEMVMDRRAEGPVGEWTDEGYDNYIEDPRYEVDPRSYGGPGYRLEEAPAVMESEDPEERRKLDMLRYLYEQGLGLNDQEVEYPDEIEESWQDLGPAREVMYNPEPYEDPEEEEEEEEGLTLPQGESLELPSKRQYLSFVPGNRKRDSMFYPAQYGPDGRWGALVVDPEREKRNELAEYERLYELAQALNGPEPERLDKRYDSYIPEDVYNDYWNRKKK